MKKIENISVLILLGALMESAAPNGFAQFPPSGLQLWLRADAGVTTNGSGYVTSWTDQSGNGRDFSWISDTNYTPKFLASALAGKPVVNFDGASDGYTDFLVRANSDVNMFASDQVDIFIVKKQVTAGTDTTLQLQGDPAGASKRVNLHLGLAGTMYFDYGNCCGSDGRISGPTPAGWLGAYHVVEAVRETSGAGNINVDLLAAVSGTFTGTLAVPTAATQMALAPHGGVAEILIYNRALSASERSLVANRLADNYGLSIPEPGAAALLIVAGVLFRRTR